jgi:hypothetical protein
MPRHLNEIQATNPALASKLTKNGYYICGDDVEPMIKVNPSIQVLVKCNTMRLVIAISMLNQFLKMMDEHYEFKKAESGTKSALVPGTDWLRDVSLLAG